MFSAKGWFSHSTKIWQCLYTKTKNWEHLLRPCRVGPGVSYLLNYFFKIFGSFQLIADYKLYTGAQLMQSQMQLKKAVKGAQATSSTLSGGVGPVSSGSVNVLVNNKNKTGLPVLAPVIDLKSTTKTASAAPATIPDPFFANRKSSKRDKSVS